jgi:hypothetical protein
VHRPFFGIQIFLAVSDFAMLLFVFQLLMFHLYLIATEQTTYMYITSKIARSKDYEAPQADLESTRRGEDAVQHGLTMQPKQLKKPIGCREKVKRK